MKRIPLTKGLFTKVDDADFKYLSQWKWHAIDSGKGFYAARQIPNPKGKPRQRKVLMHRLLAQTPNNLITDHINGDSLDNRRKNLRACTESQNNWNRKNKQKNNKSGERGVHWREEEGLWIAQIGFKYKRLYLGCFKTRIEAAKAFKKATKKYHGQYARKK